MSFCTYDIESLLWSDMLKLSQLSKLQRQHCSLHHICYYRNIYRGAWRSCKYCKMQTETAIESWSWKRSQQSVNSNPTLSAWLPFTLYPYVPYTSFSKCVRVPCTYSPAILLEMQNPEPYTRHTESEYLEVGPEDLHF